MTELEKIKEEADKAFAEKQTETTSTETNVSKNSVESKSTDVTAETKVSLSEEQPIETQQTQTQENNTEQNTVSEAQVNQQAKPETKQDVFANEELAKLNDFVKKTGKGVDEYLALQKSSSDFDKRELLKKYLSEKEGLSEKEISRELRKFENLDDEDFVDEDTLELFDIQHEKASKWYDEYRESVLSSLGTENQVSQGGQEEIQETPRYSVEEYQNMYAEQVSKVQLQNNQRIAEAIPELEDELEYGGSKEHGIEPFKFTFKPDEAYLKEATKVGLDMGVLINDFFENGQVKDAKGLLKVLTRSYAPTSKVMIDKLIEQAVLRDRISRSKDKRNVNADLYKGVEVNSNKAVQDFEKYFESSNRTPFSK